MTGKSLNKGKFIGRGFVDEKRGSMEQRLGLGIGEIKWKWLKNSRREGIINLA